SNTTTTCPHCGKELQPYMTICPYCGQDLKVTPAIQQPATQPGSGWSYGSNNPQSPRKSHRLRNILIVVVVVAVFAFLFFPFPSGTSTITSSTNTTSLITYSTTAQYGNVTGYKYTVYLFNGSISVDASYFDYSPFNVTAGAMNVTVTGNFTASGGTGNDIEVYIMNSDQYNNWYNGTTTSSYYDSGQITSANISVLLPAGQSYYLILDNSFSSISSKTVSGEIILTFFTTQPISNTTSTTTQPTSTATSTTTVTVTSTVA
ncbi:MAG: zinc ribbon domain-containing protein, partial [Nitrososphaeria archaeon]